MSNRHKGRSAARRKERRARERQYDKPSLFVIVRDEAGWPRLVRRSRS